MSTTMHSDGSSHNVVDNHTSVSHNTDSDCTALVQESLQLPTVVVGNLWRQSLKTILLIPFVLTLRIVNHNPPQCLQVHMQTVTMTIIQNHTYLPNPRPRHLNDCTVFVYLMLKV